MAYADGLDANLCNDVANSSCINTPGSFSCRCDAGFENVDGNCVEEAACESSDDCQPEEGCAPGCNAGECVSFCDTPDDGCADPTLEDVTYVSQNTGACFNLVRNGDLDCPAGTTQFNNGCGCGCISTVFECPEAGCGDGLELVADAIAAKLPPNYRHQRSARCSWAGLYLGAPAPASR